MNIQVDWNGKEKTTIPHPSVPAFRLLCEQYGIRARWNTEEKKLELEKDDLKGKKVCLIAQTDQEFDILGDVKHFLSETGMNVEIISNKTTLPKAEDLYLQCSIQTSKTAKIPEASLITPVKAFNKDFILSLQKELRDIGIATRVHRRVEKPIASPFVQIKLSLPETETTFSHELKEQLAISFASSILRYFQERHPMTLLASLSPELRQIFMGIVPDLHTTEGLISKEENISSSPESVQNNTPVEAPSISSENTLIQAEVFFDYTLILSDKEEGKWLIIGNLHIKNTGTQTLHNPQIMLRMTPPNALNIGGRTLPPNFADILGVQNSSGVTGWKYVNEDWLERGREKGEYHIGPVQPIQIMPGDTEMHSLQISIIKSKVEGSVMVEGHVYFQEQNYQCTSNNRIVLSF